MTFENQVIKVLGNLDNVVYPETKPEMALNDLISYGKHLVLEAWQTEENPTLYTSNCLESSFGFAERYLYQKSGRKEARHLDNLADLKAIVQDLLVRKNHDYGSSYEKVAKQLGVIPTFSVRILDKCNRLEELQEGPTEVLDESINDTIIDLLGYYILCIIAMQTIDKIK